MTENPKDRAQKKQRPPMMLCHYLTPATILVDEGAAQKETIINQMIDRLCQAFSLKDADLFSFQFQE